MNSKSYSSVLCVGLGGGVASRILSELRQHGLEGHSASDAREAAAIIASFSPDLVLVDPIGLRVDGLSFMGFLKTADTPFIVYSLDASDSDVAKYLDLGAVRYFPYSLPPQVAALNVRLTLKQLADIRALADTGPLTRSLVSVAARERLIGLYTSQWLLLPSQVKAIINRFARRRNVSIDEIARQKLSHNTDVLSIIRRAEAEIAEIKPGLISDLEQFWFDSHKS